MDLYNLKNKKLSQIDQKPFNLEKDIQSVVEQNTQELFNIDFVTSEFSLGNFRIDSLCYDEENKSFVIIEYKKGKSYSVIDQGYSYLSLMLNNKSDFILEYNENKKNSLKRGDVDWSSSKVIFISPSFNTYQKNSVNFQDVPFELWEIKKYSNNMISLNQHQSSSKESIQNLEGKKNSIIKDVGKEVRVVSEDELFVGKDEGIHDLFQQMKEKILDWEDVRITNNYQYFRVQKGKNIKFYIDPQKNNLKLEFLSRIDFKGDVKSKKKKFVLDDPKKLFSLLKNKYRETYTLKLKDNKNLDYVFLMLKQKFDS
jgi:hypothetical protein